MKLTRSTTTFFIASLLIAAVPTQSEARTSLGSGMTKCIEYMSINQSFPDAGRAIDLWILGYVSGLNFHTYSTQNVDLLENQNHKVVLGFINRYCSINPDKTLNNAANEYWIRLIERGAK